MPIDLEEGSEDIVTLVATLLAVGVVRPSTADTVTAPVAMDDEGVAKVELTAAAVALDENALLPVDDALTVFDASVPN